MKEWGLFCFYGLDVVKKSLDPLFFTKFYVSFMYRMARRRKNLMMDDEVIKMATKRRADIDRHRMSFTAYIERLIIEDYQLKYDDRGNPKTT